MGFSVIFYNLLYIHIWLVYPSILPPCPSPLLRPLSQLLGISSHLSSSAPVISCRLHHHKPATQRGVHLPFLMGTRHCGQLLAMPLLRTALTTQNWQSQGAKPPCSLLENVQRRQWSQCLHYTPDWPSPLRYKCFSPWLFLVSSRHHLYYELESIHLHVPNTP